MIKIIVEIIDDKKTGGTKAITTVKSKQSDSPTEHLLGRAVVIGIEESLKAMNPDDTVFGTTMEEVDAKATIARDIRRAGGG